MTDDLARLDRLLEELDRILDAPGDEEDASAELTWRKLGLMEASMGADALGAMLRRQGMGVRSVDEALAVLARRRGVV